MKTKKYFSGFTLAEVLITLTIIGILAAMTIPTLLSKYQDHANKMAWKNDFSILSNAYSLAVREAEEQGEKIFYWQDGDNGKGFNRIFLDKLKVVSECNYDNSLGIGCDANKHAWSGVIRFNTIYKTPSGAEVSAYITPSGTSMMEFYYYSALLQNNSSVYFGGINYWSGNPAHLFVVDVNNANKGPNVIGKDVFGAVSNENGVLVPIGTPQDNLNASCDLKTGNFINSIGCSAKFIIDK